MDSQRDEATARPHVEDIIDVWLEYDRTGDVSVFEDADVFAPDIMHNSPGEPPIVGKEEVIAYFDDLDPTVLDWDTTIAELTVGRDLVIAQLTYRGTEVSDTGEETEVVVGTSIDAFRWRADGSLEQIVSSPSPNEQR